jgi:tRNA pseudouridine38-40 synthase
MANFKLILSYDGTDFSGWQRQPKKRTVQGVVEEAVARIAGGRLAVIGAGRTDAGVHALAQTASFQAELRLRPAELIKALNALLPRDVRVLSVKTAPADFNARRSALGKLYQYRIYRRPVLPPFLRRYVLHWPYPLDTEAMFAAARLFIRQDDFSAFSSNRLLSPVRKVIRSELRQRGPELHYLVEADGFLRHMVRSMVGTLLEVGRGRIGPEKVAELFRKKQRTLASPTVPARGLWLVRVAYKPYKLRPMTRASSSGLK